MKTMPGKLWLLVSLSLFLIKEEGRAIVFYSQGNSYNTTDPGGGLPWNNVVEVRSSSGISGSGVYLGNRYVLTAAHVGPSELVRIGSADYSLESSVLTPFSGVDLKLLRLQNDPVLGSVRLNTSFANDSGTVTLLGYGVGRSDTSLLSTSPVAWGDASTAIKRWGTNRVDGSVPALNVGSYTSSVLYTQFNTNQGASEAALTLYDSGSALFKQVGSQWYLLGLGAYVATANSSSAYPTNVSGNQTDDKNYFIRISSYASAQDILGGVVVPEPGTGQLLMFALGVYSVMRRRTS